MYVAESVECGRSRSNSEGDKATMSSDEVNRATLALKGMLGIGSPAPKAGASSGGRESGTQAGKKKRSSKKKTPQANRRTPDGQQPRVEKLGKEKDRNASKKTADGASLQRGSTQLPDSTNGDDSNAENFAWSAFQSPPDASTLPLPVFSNSAPPTSQPAELEGNIQTDPDVAHADDLEAQLIPPDQTVKTANTSAEITSENYIKAMLNISPPADSQKETETQTQTHDHEPDTSVNSSGVNLAALASLLPKHLGSEQDQKSPYSSPPAHHPLPNNNHDQPDPISTSMNGHSYGLHSAPQNQLTFLPQMQAPFSSQGPYARQQQQHHAFVTIQVQVPPVLMPGRQMVVLSPGGYPVTVVVPDGVQPGMVLPVTLPAAPPNYSPAMMGNPLHIQSGNGGSFNMGMARPPMLNYNMSTPYHRQSIQQHQHFLQHQYRLQQHQQQQPKFESVNSQVSFGPQQHGFSSSQQQQQIFQQVNNGQDSAIYDFGQTNSASSVPDGVSDATTKN